MVVGCIDTTSNYVEHPQVVCDRLVRAVDTIGDPARVQAGTDCGFASAAGMRDVAPDVAWAKLQSLVEGAETGLRRARSCLTTGCRTAGRRDRPMT